jgi:hypothetical protein
MKEMREIETTIRSWNLRQPSACVSDAIFGGQPSVEAPRERESHTPLAFRWLVPATAGLLLLCVMANPRGTRGFSGSTNGEPMVAMILSNQSSIPYLPGSFKAEENNVPADTFEWTKVSGSNSSVHYLRGVKGRL